MAWKFVCSLNIVQQLLPRLWPFSMAQNMVESALAPSSNDYHFNLDTSSTTIALKFIFFSLSLFDLTIGFQLESSNDLSSLCRASLCRFEVKQFLVIWQGSKVKVLTARGGRMIPSLIRGIVLMANSQELLVSLQFTFQSKLELKVSTWNSIRIIEFHVKKSIIQQTKLE